ncbi:MAG: hypothetical protein N2258_05510, partial [Brevinematales bacterium]|nr:hypothetical protein [Brevinematales bacterium]
FFSKKFFITSNSSFEKEFASIRNKTAFFNLSSVDKSSNFSKVKFSKSLMKKFFEKIKIFSFFIY